MSTTYDFTPEQIEVLQAALAASPAGRKPILRAYASNYGAKATAELFAEFMVMALSVEENARTFHELFFVVEAGLHPHEAGDMNLATLKGALEGARLARPATKGMCGGCAFRLGTHANQALVTIQDAQYALEEGSMTFMCHHDLDIDEEPVSICAGFAATRAERAAKERAA